MENVTWPREQNARSNMPSDYWTRVWRILLNRIIKRLQAGMPATPEEQQAASTASGLKRPKLSSNAVSQRFTFANLAWTETGSLIKADYPVPDHVRISADVDYLGVSFHVHGIEVDPMDHCRAVENELSWELSSVMELCGTADPLEVYVHTNGRPYVIYMVPFST